MPRHPHKIRNSLLRPRLLPSAGRDPVRSTVLRSWSTSMTGPGSTAPRQFAFTTRAHMAVDDATGEPIGLDDVDTRVGWLLDLITAAGAELVSRLWQPATFDVLATGLDRHDRRLPAQGHVAAARLGWNPRYPDGIYVPSRVGRVVTADVVATLRTLTFRDTAIAALSARFDPATGAVAPPTESADYVPPGFVRGVQRQLAAHARRSGAAPAGRLRITDVQGPPKTSAMAQLSAADRQLAQITMTKRELVLTVKLPTAPAPAGRAQWRRVRLTAAIPTHLHGRAVTDWHLPTLVLDRRGLLWRCAATELVPVNDPKSAAVAVGVDWSPSTLGAAAIAAEGPSGLSSDYRGWTYDDRGLGIKLGRLQAEGQMLHRKAARLTRLAATAPPEVRALLEEKIAVLNEHREAVGIKRGRINRELAFHFARQVTDYAAAADAEMIAVEDLTTLRDSGPRAGQQQPGRAVRPPTSGRRARAHRRRCRRPGGLGAGPGIVRTVSGLRRTTCTPRRLPHRVVSPLPGRRQPRPPRRGEPGQTRVARQKQGHPSARTTTRDPGGRTRAGAAIARQERSHPEQATAPTGSPQPAHRHTAVGGESETACSCTTSVGVGHGQTHTTAR